MIFSIIVPICNGEKFINRLLSLIEIQSIPKECSIELILAENGSSDKTPEICRDYADKHDNVKALTLGKVGSFMARREGMRVASGDYLIFCDADDELLPGAVESIYYALTRAEKEPDILIYNAVTDRYPRKKKFDFPFENGRIYEHSDKEVFYRIMCRNDSLNVMWNKAVKKDVALKALGDEVIMRAGCISHGEDLVQTAAFLNAAESISYLDRALYLYRTTDNGLTSGFHPDYIPDQTIAWNILKEYMKNWNVQDEEANVARRKSLTCTIGVKSIIYADKPMSVKKKVLKEIMDLAFYKKYAEGILPEWAGEEDIFIHNLIISENPEAALLHDALKTSVKRFIKTRILKNGN